MRSTNQGQLERGYFRGAPDRVDGRRRKPKSVTSIPPRSSTEPTASPIQKGAINVGRLVAFSDAVFAISVTLLVLDLRLGPLPPAADPEVALRDGILALIPGAIAYITSFLVVVTYWIGHHRIFERVRYADEGLMWLNMCLLLCVAFLPVPQSVLISHGDRPLATAFYAGWMAVTGLAAWFVWAWAIRLGQVKSGTRRARMVSISILSAPVVFVLSIPLAYVFHPYVAELSWALILPIRVLLARRSRTALAIL